jgi:AcrR family transcriptional regulator
MDDIAGRAGVGVGTVYRHFPTKDALVRALVFEHMSGFATLGREALERDVEPWTAFADWMWRCAEHHHEDRALCQVLASESGELPRQAALETGLQEVSGELMRRAQEAGAVRADAVVFDIPLVMCGLGAVLQSQWGPEAWRRYFTLVLDGLRACDGERLPDAG